MNRKLNLIIADDPRALRTDKIGDLCEYLTARVLEPRFAREGHRWERRFMNFFTFDDATDPMDPTGRIRLEVPLLFAGREQQLEDAVRDELTALGICVGPILREDDPVLPHRQTLLIPILENPTVLLSPPDVYMGYNRGCVVLRDLLGYQQVEGRYEFAAEDLLRRVSTLTEERIAHCTAAPLAGPEGIRRRPSAVSIRSVKRCLDEIRQFALWAARHNYRALAAV